MRRISRITAIILSAVLLFAVSAAAVTADMNNENKNEVFAEECQ